VTPAPLPAPGTPPATAGGASRPVAGRGHPWVLPGIGGAVLVLAAVAGAHRAVAVVGTGLQLLFIAFFVRHLAFAAAALSFARADLQAPVVDDGYRPSVSVLVACKNEQAVVERLVEGLVALDYPRHLLQWIVVDDASTDATGELLDRWAARIARLHVLHREPGAGGGKSGALNDALGLATGEIVIVFDADHRPRPDVVRRLVRHFADPGVGAVQGRCEIANGDDSPLATLVAIDYLAGYLVNEYGRQAVFRLPAYGGANCAVRASWLRALGGWNPRSVTEDTDLTMRLVLAGARVRYDVTAVDEEEGVVSFDRYWSQRYRWARGHQQVWRDYRRAVWHSPRLTLAEKLETTMFLSSFHLPVLSMVGVVFLFAWVAGLSAPVGSAWLFVFTTLLFLGPLTEIGGGLLLARADRRLALRLLWFLPLFFVSMAVSSAAWIDAAFGRRYSWVKTRRAGDPAGAPTRPATGGGLAPVGGS